MLGAALALIPRVGSLSLEKSDLLWSCLPDWAHHALFAVWLLCFMFFSQYDFFSVAFAIKLGVEMTAKNYLTESQQRSEASAAETSSWVHQTIQHMKAMWQRFSLHLEVELRLLSFTSLVFGIQCIYLSPVFSCMGASMALLVTVLGLKILQPIDQSLDGFWHSLPPVFRYTPAILGSILLYIFPGFPVLSWLAVLVAMKFGANLVA